MGHAITTPATAIVVTITSNSIAEKVVAYVGLLHQLLRRRLRLHAPTRMVPAATMRGRATAAMGTSSSIARRAAGSVDDFRCGVSLAPEFVGMPSSSKHCIAVFSKSYHADVRVELFTEAMTRKRALVQRAL